MSYALIGTALVIGLLGCTSGTPRSAPDAVLGPGREWFVATDGSPTGAGSKTAPWDLATALAQPSEIQPGDTIWIAGGTYVGHFESVLTGTRGARVIVRALHGARATIADDRATAEGATLQVNGAWTDYRDLEITNTSPDRLNMPAGTDRPMGLQIQAPDTRFINLVVHDTGSIGFWEEAVDAEFYGCIVYHIGWSQEDGGYGHGLYTQNEVGTKRIVDNVFFDQFNWGIHVYPGPGDTAGYVIEGNAIFGSGALADPPLARNAILVNPHTSYTGDRIEIRRNMTWISPDLVQTGEPTEVNVCIGCIDERAAGSVTVSDNVLVGGPVGIAVAQWSDVTITGNRIVADQFGGVMVRSGEGGARWVGNEYTDLNGPPTFANNGSTLNLDGWRELGFDATGTVTTTPPTGTSVHVRPNLYEPGRAHVVVYNWDRAARVAVDLSSVLTAGASYEIRSVQDLFGPPVATGAYVGGTIELPMSDLPAAPAVGGIAGKPTGPAFHVFLVTVPHA